MQQLFDLVHTEQIFSEEDNIRFHHAADTALRAGCFSIDIAESFQDMAAVKADGLVDLSVNMTDICISGFFVQGVNVLGDNADGARVFFLQFSDGEMCRVWFGLLNFNFQFIVKIVHEGRIALKAFDGGNVFNAMVVP